ncbi:MAG: TIM barrel protein [Promethearchaeota archaeon]
MWNEISEKVSYHVVYDISILDALYYANNSGFAGIQIAVEAPHLSFEYLSDSQCKKINSICDKLNSYITLHGPDIITSLFTTNSRLKQGIFSYYTDLFTFAKKVNARLITIHLGEYTTFPTDTEPQVEISAKDMEIYQITFHENLKTLLKLADHQFIICVENYNFRPFILDILKYYLTEEQLWLCWDLAKTYNKDNNKNNVLERFYIENIKSIKQIHLHDLNSYGKGHKVIGSGIIDFIYYLKQLDFSKVMDFCIEVRPREKAYESLQNLKNLIKSKG